MTLVEALNPVLVKEVRQSLRGRYFRSSFLATIALALLVALVTIATNTPTTQPLGEPLFTSIFVYLLAATQFLVPFAAFLSLSQEWEENTLDLLLLSNLRPRQIVMGKLLAAGIHVMIYYSAFTPFVVVAFLLRGLDLVNLLSLLALSALASLVLTVVALALSSLGRTRPSRILLMALLSGLSVYVVVTSPRWAFVVLRSTGWLHSSTTAARTLFTVTMAITVAAFAFAVACGRLSHAQENRSTQLRVLTAITGASLTGWTAYLYHATLDCEMLVQSAIVTSWLLALPCLFLVTEAEMLPAITRRRAPRSGTLALLAAPLLPGGGRGFLFWLIMQGLPTAAVFLLVACWPPSTSLLMSGERAWYANLMFTGALLGLPSVLTQSMTTSLAGRVRARCMCVILLAALMAGPIVVGFFLDDRELTHGHHFGNPLWFSHRMWDGRHLDRPWFLSLAITYAVTFWLNLPRMVRGIAEVARASAARRAYRQAHRPAECT